MDAVTAAFDAVPREEFLSPEDRDRAVHDGPLPIGHGQTNSQPRTVADMLRLLDVGPGQKVLDVGSGSGWTTALLAQMTGPAGSVLGLEVVPDLVAFGAENLARAGSWPHARIEAADPGVLGRPEEAPFDRILVSAMAAEMPHSLVEQLADGGMMVVPVEGRMLRVIRTPDGVDVSEHGRYLFVPLQ